MPDSVQGCEKRRYRRVKGPFGGRYLGPTKTHVVVTDLNLGGGFIKFTDTPPDSSTFVLRINLHEGPVTVNAETVHSDESGYGVRFFNLDTETILRLGRTIDSQQGYQTNRRRQ
jgi:hypothetical protein